MKQISEHMLGLTAKRFALMLAFALFGLALYGQQRPCSTAEADKADREASRLRSWGTLYNSYKRFHHCDDGSIAEGFSESVGRILVGHWNTLPEISSVSDNDPKFRTFILRHVSATLAIDDLKKIRRNALSRCPDGESEICKQLKIASDRALWGNLGTGKPGGNLGTDGTFPEFQ